VDVMSLAMYPGVATDFFKFRDQYGPVTKLDTRVFLIGPKVGQEFEATIEKGKTLSFKTLAVAADLTKAGLREVFFELNGQLRSVFIRDKEAQKELHIHPKADKNDKCHVAAPMSGSIIDIRVEEGKRVEKGTPLLVLSAMKMEMIVQAPVSGVVHKIHINKTMKLEAEDLLITMKE